MAAVDPTGYQYTLQQIIDKTSARTGDRNTGELGKDDFLNLLVTQLRYQDPLNPMDDKEFIGQMAQFSSLEQMQNMNNSIVQSQAFSLMGKHVTATLVDEETDETSQISGAVTNVKIESGKAYVVVKGHDIPMERVLEVSDGMSSSDASLHTYARLIGTTTQGFVYDPDTGNVVGVSGYVASLQKGQYEDYVVMNNVEVDVSSIITETPPTDPNFKEDYLAANKGRTADLEVVDRTTGHKVPVRATLKDYSIDGDGNITAVLDNLYVSVDSISGITGADRPALSDSTSLIGFRVSGRVHDDKYQNYVALNGVVKSLKAGISEDYAVIDGVNAEIVEIADGELSSDPNYKKNYLEEHLKDNVSVVVKDPETGNRVTVNAVLDSYEYDEATGDITAVLNGVNLPIESVTDVQPAD